MNEFTANLTINVFKTAVSLVSSLSNRTIIKLTEFLTFLHVVFPNKSYPQFVINNSVIYPKKTEEEVRELSKQNMFTALASLLFSLKFSSKKFRDDLDLNLEITGKENLKKIKKGQGMICVAPHLGLNTLTVKFFAETVNRECLIIMRQNWGSEKLETFVRKHYGSDKVKIVKLGGSMPKVEKTLKTGGVVLLAVDAVLPIKYKQTVDFFGRKFDLSTGPAWLAEKFDVPLITAYGTFEKDTQTIGIHIDSPLDVGKTTGETTQKLAKRLEKYIFDNPGQWFQSDDYFGISGKKH